MTIASGLPPLELGCTGNDFPLVVALVGGNKFCSGCLESPLIVAVDMGYGEVLLDGSGCKH